MILSQNQVDKLIWLNFLAFVVHLSLAVVVGTVGNINFKQNVYTTDLIFVYNSTGDGFELEPFYEKGSLLPLTILVVVIESITAFVHLGNCAIWVDHYITSLENHFSYSRWIEYGVTASLMALLISFTAGVREVMLLCASVVTIATTQCFGFLAELVNKTPRDAKEWRIKDFHRYLPTILGFVPFLLFVSIVLVGFISGGGVRCADAYVTAVVCGEIVLFSTFVGPQLYQLSHSPTKFVYGEYAYIGLSFVAKVFLSLTLLIGVLQTENFDGSDVDINDVDASCSLRDISL